VQSQVDLFHSFPQIRPTLMQLTGLHQAGVCANLVHLPSWWLKLESVIAFQVTANEARCTRCTPVVLNNVEE
jgi:hypothetical protein